VLRNAVRGNFSAPQMNHVSRIKWSQQEQPAGLWRYCSDSPIAAHTRN